MHRTVLAATAALFLASTAAFAQSATVNIDIGANMKSLRDPEQHDVFTAKISDSQIVTNLEVTCSAGTSKWFGAIRSDETCAVAGNGSVVNPKNGALLPRTQYLGGFVVKSDGYTDGSTLAVNYLALGNVQASAAQFGGNLMMKPENPSPTAKEIGLLLVSQITGEGEELIDDRIDTVTLERFYIPSAGLPQDKGCTWAGDKVYAYQTDSWLIKLKSDCNGKTYELTGNMPWVDLDDEGNAQYNLTLTLPSAGVATNDALFADATGGDLFATADGISATINIVQSGFVTVEVDGAPEELASQVQATGTFTGTNVPLEVVRSLATYMAITARTFFGA